MKLDTRYIEPQELTGYVRAALADLPQNRFALATYLPDNLVDDIEYRVKTGGGGLATVAVYRAFDTESPIGARRGIEDLRGALPPISEKIPLGEHDRLTMRRLDDRIKQQILDDGVRQATNILARAEVGRGELLADGKVTISENGVDLVVDFGRRGSHSPTAAKLWSAADSTPIDDLLAWVATYRQTNGVRPGGMLISDTLEALLMRHPQVRSMTQAPGVSSQIVTVDVLQSLLRSLRIPQYTVYEAQVAGPNQTALDIIDPTKVVFLPPEGHKIGETTWGITAEALEPKYGIDETHAPGIVVGSYVESDPLVRWTKASAIMLPIAPNIDLTLGAKVLA